jgi:chromosome segregation ATPase
MGQCLLKHTPLEENTVLSSDIDGNDDEEDISIKLDDETIESDAIDDTSSSEDSGVKKRKKRSNKSTPRSSGKNKDRVVRSTSKKEVNQELIKSNVELKDQVKELTKRLRKHQKKHDSKVLKHKSSKKKLQQKLDNLRQELLDCQQQIAESKFQIETSCLEKEQLEKRLKETIFRFQSDFSEKIVLLNGQLSNIKNEKDVATAEMSRLHEIITVLMNEKKNLEEKVLISILQVKDNLVEEEEENGIGSYGEMDIKENWLNEQDQRNMSVQDQSFTETDIDLLENNVTTEKNLIEPESDISSPPKETTPT